MYWSDQIHNNVKNDLVVCQWTVPMHLLLRSMEHKLKYRIPLYKDVRSWCYIVLVVTLPSLGNNYKLQIKNKVLYRDITTPTYSQYLLNTCWPHVSILAITNIYRLLL